MDDPRPAGFWIRVAAALIDLVLISLVDRSFVAVARVISGMSATDAWGAASGFTIIFAAAYTTALHAVGGQTIGKALAGVRVVATGGETPSAGQAFLRHIAYAISLLPFGLGYFMAGLRRDKRALHDLIAGTRVVRTRGVPATPRTAPVDAETGELVPPIG